MKQNQNPDFEPPERFETELQQHRTDVVEPWIGNREAANTAAVNKPTNDAETLSQQDKSGQLNLDSAKPKAVGLISVIVTIMGLALVWAPALFFYKKMPPEYISAWTILIPGSNVGTSIDLESTGQANTSIASQYSTAGIDPKVNYKAIALSLPVRKKAAAVLDLPVAEIEKPKVKLTQQTSLMQVVFTEEDADVVSELANAYYDAFIEQLEVLRDEIQQIKQSETLSQVNEHKQNVQRTTQNLDIFRAENGFVSSAQHDALQTELQNLYELRSRSEIEEAATRAELDSLQNTLNLKPQAAARILELQQDALFQALVESYASSYVAWLDEISVLGRKNPKVIARKAESDRHKDKLWARASELLKGKGTLDEIGLLPALSETNVSMFQDYIALEAKSQGLRQQVEKIKKEQSRREQNLSDLTLLSSQLEHLEREQEVATTIYASALARVDLENIDRFSVYPITQLLTPAEKPEAPEKLKKLLLIAAAVMGSLLILLAASIYWTRFKWLPAIRKS